MTNCACSLRDPVFLSVLKREGFTRERSKKLNLKERCHKTGQDVIRSFFIILFPNIGSGKFIYIEASAPRRRGDTARLESPWMQGPQCMTFYYHMFGSTMSCVVIYVQSHKENRIKPVWLQSEDRGDQWIREQINLNETRRYKVGLWEVKNVFIILQPRK